MKIQIDTEEKTISIEEDITLATLREKLNNFFNYELIKDFRLIKTKETIINVPWLTPPSFDVPTDLGPVTNTTT